MKSLILISAFILTIFTGQSQTIEGTYANKWVASTGEGIAYMLTLHEGGEFTFDYTRMHLDSHPDTKVEVKGTWTMEGHLLVLSTNAEDATDNAIASGLDLNKARFVSVSPRHPNFNLVKPSLKFYESEVFYAKNMELLKTETSTTTASRD